MTERELRDYIPFISVRDGAVLSKKGDITFGWELLLPTAFTVNEEGYDSIMHSFLQAYKLLPVYCVVHKQDVYRYEVYRGKPQDFFLDQTYEKHFEGRPYLNGHSYIYVTFSSKATVESDSGGSGFFGILDRKVPRPDDIRKAADVASQFEAVLNNNPLLVARPLSTGDFLRIGPGGRDEGVIPDYVRMYSPGGADYNLEFHKDRVVQGEQTLKVWYVEDSDAFPTEVSSVRQVPEMSSGYSRVVLSGGSPIGYRLRIPHVVNSYIAVLPKNQVEKELDQQKRLNNSFSAWSESCNVNARELGEYLYDAAKNSTTTIKCFLDVMAWCSPNEMADIRNRVVTAFSDLDVSVVEEMHGAPQMHYAGIPGAAAELGYECYLTSEITAFMCHALWDGYDSGHRDGIIHVCDRNSMTPLVLEMQSGAIAKGMTGNQNMFVVGPSGSGKSYTMNSLCQDFYTSGQHVMIIDVGDSYQGLCSVINEASGGKDGIYNTYDPEHPFSFNPFRGRSAWNETDSDGDRVSSGFDFILSLFQTIYQPREGWNEVGKSVLIYVLNQFLSWWDGGVPENVVEELRMAYVNAARSQAEHDHKRFSESAAVKKWVNPVAEVFPEGRPADPVFDDFYQYVTRILLPLVSDGRYRMGEDIVVTEDVFSPSQFGMAMDIWKIGGTYGYLLNTREDVDLFSSRFTVFEVDQIKDNQQLFPIWTLCILHSFEDKMRSLSCQKVMVIEEAWSAIAKESMANFIVWMWRTARKFSTTACVVTQSLGDLMSSEIVKDAIVHNTDVKILLDQRKDANNFQYAIQTLGLSKMATSLVLSVNTALNPDYRYKEAFIAIGEGYCNVFAIEKSLEQAICFESKKSKKEIIFRRAKECGSFIEAVRSIAKDIRKGRIDW